MLRLKNILVFLMIELLPYPSISQDISTSFSEFFYGRKPSAKAESMGRTFTTIDGDLSSIFFNPAGLAGIEKSEVCLSYTPPPNYSTLGYYIFAAASYKINHHFGIAFSRYRFDYGKTPFALMDEKVYEEHYTVTLFLEPLENLMIGGNVNYFVWKTDHGSASNPISFDLGFLKKIPLQLGGRNQQLRIGGSIKNFTYSHLKAYPAPGYAVKYPFPVIANIGIGYVAAFGQSHIVDSAYRIKISLNTEYQTLLNSKYQRGIMTGGEIAIANLFFLRAGYYSTKVFDYNLPEYNKSRIQSYTYGGGIRIPIHSLTSIPIDIYFDYANLPQVSHTWEDKNYPSFSNYTFRLVFRK